MLGENIKAIRKNKGYTQEELAAKLNVTRQTVSKWEKGYSVPDAGPMRQRAKRVVLIAVEKPSGLSRRVPLKSAAAKEG